MAVIGGGGGIKSIQRGTVSVAKNSSSTVTINAIDMAKTFVNTSCENGWIANEYYGVHAFAISLQTNCVLTNTTTLTCSTGTMATSSQIGTAAPVLSWEVVEYA